MEVSAQAGAYGMADVAWLQICHLPAGIQRSEGYCAFARDDECVFPQKAALCGHWWMAAWIRKEISAFEVGVEKGAWNICGNKVHERRN